MSKVRLKKTKFHTELEVEEKDLQWGFAEHKHYRTILTLHHIPSGEKIIQASDINSAEAKGFCLRELQHRLCAIPAPDRFCGYCGKKITEGGKKRMYCGEPCRGVASKNARAARKKERQEA